MATVLEPKFRCPTKGAILKLAEKFSLPNVSSMQDWEYEVADCNRINEFVSAFKSDSLSDDERFTLLEIIIQSFEDSEIKLEVSELWHQVLSLVKLNLDLHAYTLWYWSDYNHEVNKDSWKVTEYTREIYAKYV